MEYCLNENCFPDEWKKGTLINIAKPNCDHKQHTNYRPITLLPVLGKIYEKILRNTLTKVVGEKIPKHQFGFKEKCSTLHPLMILASNIETAKHQNLKTAALFMDIEKAFDNVWHKGLLYKLHKLKTPRYLINIIKKFLENRTIQIRVNSYKSAHFSPEQGVPQGSPLSPLLYNIYCLDIVDNNNIDKSKYVLQFADDTSLISHASTIEDAANKLQNLINDIEKWFQKWRLIPNPLKSQYILFNHTIQATSPQVSVFNQPIRPKPNAKYLGIDIDAKLNLKNYTKKTKSETIGRAKQFRSLTYKNQGINIKTAKKNYKSICRPILEYGHAIFLNLRPPAMKNICVAETSALRAITKIRHPQNELHNPSNELLYQKTNIQPIKERIYHLTGKFVSRPQNLHIIEPHCRTSIQIQISPANNIRKTARLKTTLLIYIMYNQIT